MSRYLVVVIEEYSIDEHGNEIPGTRIKKYCVKDTLHQKIEKCFDKIKDAKDCCELMNDLEDKPTSSGSKKKPNI